MSKGLSFEPTGGQNNMHYHVEFALPLHTWDWSLTPSGGVEFWPPSLWGRCQNYFKVKPRKRRFSTTLSCPRNHNVPRWKFSLQKCFKSQITPFLTIEEPPWYIRKMFRREIVKNEIIRKSILTPTPPLDPMGASTVPTYAYGTKIW